MPRPLRTDEVAQLLNTTPANVHKMVQAKRLKAHRSGKGNRLLFDTHSVAAEMLKRKGAEETSTIRARSRAAAPRRRATTRRAARRDQ